MSSESFLFLCQSSWTYFRHLFSLQAQFIHCNFLAVWCWQYCGCMVAVIMLVVESRCEILLRLNVEDFQIQMGKICFLCYQTLTAASALYIVVFVKYKDKTHTIRHLIAVSVWLERFQGGWKMGKQKVGRKLILQMFGLRW